MGVLRRLRLLFGLLGMLLLLLRLCLLFRLLSVLLLLLRLGLLFRLLCVLLWLLLLFRLLGVLLLLLGLRLLFRLLRVLLWGGFLLLGGFGLLLPLLRLRMQGNDRSEKQVRGHVREFQGGHSCPCLREHVDTQRNILRTLVFRIGSGSNYRKDDNLCQSP